MTIRVTSSNQIKRSEIWWVQFRPQLGAEIDKIRPAVVISSDGVGRLPLKVVVPITDWSPSFVNNVWHVQLMPDSQNNLSKVSSADTLQIKSVAFERFQNKIGILSAAKMEEIAAAVAIVIDYQ